MLSAAWPIGGNSTDASKPKARRIVERVALHGREQRIADTGIGADRAARLPTVAATSGSSASL